MPNLLIDPPRFLFFTGKGGVGKTSIACATAIALANEGRRVLLVSTDPASNVGQALGTTIGNSITRIPTVDGLAALEIDPEQAADAYRERIIGPVRGLLPDREISSITEQLSGSCTTEVASFNEFTSLLADPVVYSGYDHIVFDTAPTGHTIRLLQLPGSWTDFLNDGKGDASCLGPLAGLDKQRSIYAEAVATLTDAARTRLILVTRAQVSAIAEIDRTASELAAIGIHATNVVINGVLPGDAGGDPLSTAIRLRERAALDCLPASLAGLTRDVIALKASNMVGIPALTTLLAEDAVVATDVADHFDIPEAPLSALIDELERDDHGLIMCMGKGGVGKTTIAASIAVALAHRGHDVHLTTTDPAAHLQDTLAGAVDRLRVSRIDPVRATREYRDRIMSTGQPRRGPALAVH
jgi:arsenite-transporting ATPase